MCNVRVISFCGQDNSKTNINIYKSMGETNKMLRIDFYWKAYGSCIVASEKEHTVYTFSLYAPR